MYMYSYFVLKKTYAVVFGFFGFVFANTSCVAPRGGCHSLYFLNLLNKSSRIRGLYTSMCMCTKYALYK